MNRVMKIRQSQMPGLPMKQVWVNLKKYREDYLFILPYMAIFTVFTIIPVLASIFLSFTYFNILEPPRWIGLGNYFRLLLDDGVFLIAIKNTLFLSVLTGPVSFMLCLFLAWLVNEFPARLRTLLTLLFYAPTLGGSVFLIWQVIFSDDSYGLLNAFLVKWKIIYVPIRWLTDVNYMMSASVVVILWLSLGTSFLAFIAGFQNVDGSLYEAGAMDGVKNRWQELWFITLPSMRPQLLFGAVMSITGSFGIGGVITGLVGFPSTGYAVHTMVHHLEDYGNIRFEMGYASAIATLLFCIMIASNKIVQAILKKVGG